MMPHVWVEDITNNMVLRDVATWLSSVVYAEKYSDGRDPSELYETIGDRVMENERILMAFSVMEPDADAEVLGAATMRLGRDGTDPSRTGLEFMKLFEPVSGSWADYNELGFRPGDAGEASRLAFGHRCLERSPAAQKLRAAVMWQLLLGAATIGRSQGYSQCWAVLARHVRRAARETGMIVREADGLRLRSDADSLIATMPKYFGRLKPRLCRIGFPTEACRNPLSGETVPISSTPVCSENNTAT